MPKLPEHVRDVEPRSFTFDWRFDDHAAVTSLLVREQFASGIWRVTKWFVVAIVLIAACVTIAVTAIGDWYSTIQLAPLVLIVAALVLGFPRLTGKMRAWQVRRTDPNVRHPFNYTFADSGLHIDLHTVEAELKWEGMLRVRETSDMLLFYYSRLAAYFLPKRVVGKAADLEALGQWIRDRLPETVPYLKDEA